MNAAVVLVAAGKSSRMGGGRNKVLLPLAGKPVLSYSLRIFDQHPQIRTIALVGREEDQSEMESLVSATVGTTAVHFVPGGFERFDSVRNGVLSLEAATPEAVLIHDAARPFLTPAFIDDSLEALIKTGGAVVGVPLKDTLKRVDQDNTVQETPDRTQYWLAQTPQTFRYREIVQAYKQIEVPPYPTDDGQVFEWYGGTVTMVMGSYQNMKLTTPEDIALAEGIITTTSPKSI